MPVANTNLYEDIAGTGVTVITTRLGDTFLIDTDDRAIAERHCWSLHEHGYARAVARIDGKLKTVTCTVSCALPRQTHLTSIISMGISRTAGKRT